MEKLAYQDNFWDKRTKKTNCLAITLKGFLSKQDVSKLSKQHMCTLNFCAEEKLDGFANVKAPFWPFLQIVSKYNF